MLNKRNTDSGIRFFMLVSKAVVTVHIALVCLSFGSALRLPVNGKPAGRFQAHGVDIWIHDA